MPDDEKPDEGNPQSSAGGKEQSTSSTSDDKGQPLPEYVTAILSRLDGVEKLAKGVQKGTDKQIASQVNNSIERILELAKEGKTKAQIERELWIDQQIQGTESADPKAAGDNASKGNSLDITAIDDLLELPANDSRVTDLKLKHSGDPKAYLREGLILLARLGDQREATPGEQPGPQGTTGSTREVNPIANIDDPKTLYRMAAKQIATKATGRKRGVAS